MVLVCYPAVPSTGSTPGAAEPCTVSCVVGVGHDQVVAWTLEWYLEGCGSVQIRYGSGGVGYGEECSLLVDVEVMVPVRHA